MFRPIRMDHTNCLQVAIKTLQFNSCHYAVVFGQDASYMPHGARMAAACTSSVQHERQMYLQGLLAHATEVDTSSMYAMVRSLYRPPCSVSADFIVLGTAPELLQGSAPGPLILQG